MKKWIKRVFLLLGIGVLVWLINELGWQELLNNLKKIGWWGIPILALAVIWNIFHTLAWHQILKFMGHRLPLFQLFKLKLIAEAVNQVAPSANLGGDTARAYLIRSEGVPITDGLPSVMIDKTIDYITKMLFNIIGLAASLFLITIPPMYLWGCVAYLLIVLILNGLWVAFQVKGLSSSVMKIAKWIPPLLKFLESKKSQMATLDQTLKKSYTEGISSLMKAGIYHTIGRTLGVFEVMLITWLLGIPIPFIEAFFFITVVNVVMGAFFLVPGQTGVIEAAQVEILKQLGYKAEIGLGVGIVRRIRKLIFTGVGLLLFALYDKKEEIEGLKNGNPSPNA